MREVMTKAMARNIFLGGSLFFIVIFVGLTLHSHRYIVTVSTASMELSDAVVRGKHVWERHSCINCHSLHGEGAYFAPEIGNVLTRWGVLEDADASFEALKAWMDAQPSGVEGRRQMPAFGLSDDEYRDLSEFLRWTDKMDTQGWPPNDAG